MKSFDFSKFSEEEITQMRIQRKELDIKGKKYYALDSIVDNATWIICFIVFFIVHWRLYKRNKEK